MDQLRPLRGGRRAASDLAATGDFALRPGRVHEFCGPARRGLALRVAGRLSGPVLWIRPAWQAERLNPDGICDLVEPGRLIFVDCRRTEDQLWCLEEALRSGAVALAVADLLQPPALTPVRRLHLAAEAGAGAGPAGRGKADGPAPIGLLLTPGSGGAAGVESRWQATPAHRPEAAAWHIARLRARAAPPRAWQMDAAGALTPLPAGED